MICGRISTILSKVCGGQVGGVRPVPFGPREPAMFTQQRAPTFGQRQALLDEGDVLAHLTSSG